MRLIIFYLSLILFFGCVKEKTGNIPEHLKNIENLSVYPDNPTPSNSIELIREVSFGETDEVFFGRWIDNIDVDNNGRVFIADMFENSIYIYESDGTYLQSIGRGGQGPGEFQMIWDMKIHDEKIHVLDYQYFKISVFGLNTFDHVQDHDISLHSNQDNQPTWIKWTREEGLFYRPTNMFVRADNTYLLLFSDEGVASADNVDDRTYEASIYDPLTGGFAEHDLFTFDWSGQVLVHEEGDADLILFRVPYKRNSLFDFSNNQFVHGWSEDMLFRVYDENGEYQKAFYYPYSNNRLHIDDVLRHYEGADENLINAIRSDDHPETWPAFHSLIMDDENRIWLSTITDDQENYEWWVLDDAGELIAKFTWPRNRDLKKVKNGYLYTLERNIETELQEVVRYKVIVEI
jgi:hypothetical protein